MLYTNRQFRILKLLLELENKDYIKISTLAKQLKVSSRTIFRELKAIEPDLSKYNLKLQSSNKGLVLLGKVNDKKEFYDNLVVDSTLDKKDRRLMLIVYLLSNNEVSKLSNYANDLKVSEATISNDIVEITDILGKYNINLDKNNKQIKIVGQESDKRKLLIRVIMELLNTDKFSMEEIILDDSGDLLSIQNSILYMAINRDSLNLAVALSYKYFKKLNIFDTTLNAYINLIIHIAILIDRLKNQNTINGELDHDLTDINDKNYHIAECVIKDIKEYYDIKFVSDIEIKILALHIQASKINNDNDNEYVNEIINKIINNFPMKYRLIFVQDNELIEGLKKHLVPTLYRLEHKLKIDNPLKQSIKSEYFKIYSYTKKACEFIKNINDDEICYLTIHFCASLEREKFNSIKRKLNIGIICINGIGISSLLSAKLNKIYQGIAMFEAVSSNEIADVSSRYDFLVTTVDVKINNIDLVKIGISLDEDDLAKINNKINHYNYTNPYNKNIIENNETAYFETISIASKKSLEILEGISIEIDESDNLSNLIDKHITECSDKKQLMLEINEREKYGKTYLEEKKLRYYHTLSETIKHSIIKIIKIQDQIVVIMLGNNDITQVEKELLGLISSSFIENNIIYDYIKNNDLISLKNFYKNLFKQYIKKI